MCLLEVPVSSKTKIFLVLIVYINRDAIVEILKRAYAFVSSSALPSLSLSLSLSVSLSLSQAKIDYRFEADQCILYSSRDKG